MDPDGIKHQGQYQSHELRGGSDSRSYVCEWILSDMVYGVSDVTLRLHWQVYRLQHLDF